MRWFRKRPLSTSPVTRPCLGRPAARIEPLEQRSLLSATIFIGTAFVPAEAAPAAPTHHAPPVHAKPAHAKPAHAKPAHAKPTHVKKQSHNPSRRVLPTRIALLRPHHKTASEPARVRRAAAASASGAAGFQFTATRPGVGTTPVSITRFDGSSQPIRTSVRTWILIHGYKGNGHTAGLTQLYNALHVKYPADQILTLDWSAAAADTTYADTEQWLPVIGVAAANALAPAGFAPGSLNLIGYSFGTYIADELAAHLSGGVNTIAAIDPPMYEADGPGSYDPETSVNFAAHSRYSWALHDADAGSSLGDAITPTTADTSFSVTGTSHGAIIGLFDNLVAGSDPVSERFQVSHLLAHDPGPWAPGRYDTNGKPTTGGANGGYEALLTTTAGGTAPVALSYFNSVNGAMQTLKA